MSGSEAWQACHWSFSHWPPLIQWCLTAMRITCLASYRSCGHSFWDEEGPSASMNFWSRGNYFLLWQNFVSLQFVGRTEQQKVWAHAQVSLPDNGSPQSWANHSVHPRPPWLSSYWIALWSCHYSHSHTHLKALDYLPGTGFHVWRQSSGHLHLSCKVCRSPWELWPTCPPECLGSCAYSGRRFVAWRRSPCSLTVLLLSPCRFRILICHWSSFECS